MMEGKVGKRNTGRSHSVSNNNEYSRSGTPNTAAKHAFYRVQPSGKRQEFGKAKSNRPPGGDALQPLTRIKNTIQVVNKAVKPQQMLFNTRTPVVGCHLTVAVAGCVCVSKSVDAIELAVCVRGVPKPLSTMTAMATTPSVMPNTCPSTQAQMNSTRATSCCRGYTRSWLCDALFAVSGVCVSQHNTLLTAQAM